MDVNGIELFSGCKAKSCQRSTSEGKPYCEEHLAESPYIRSIVAEVEIREAEEARIRKEGYRGVDLNGHLVAEVLSLLALGGVYEVCRVHRILGTKEYETAMAIVRALVKSGKVVHYQESKKSEGTIQLTEFARDYAELAEVAGTEDRPYARGTGRSSVRYKSGLVLEQRADGHNETHRVAPKPVRRARFPESAVSFF